MKHLISGTPLVLALVGAIPAQAQAQSVGDSLKQATLQEVVVKGVRAQHDAPFAVANIGKKNLTHLARQVASCHSSLPTPLVCWRGARMALERVQSTCAFVALRVAALT